MFFSNLSVGWNQSQVIIFTFFFLLIRETASKLMTPFLNSEMSSFKKSSVILSNKPGRDYIYAFVTKLQEQEVFNK